MVLDSQFYIVSALVIGYPLVLIVALTCIRLANKKKPLGSGERRQFLTLRRTLNVMLVVALLSLIVFVGWQLWLIIKFDNVSG